MSSFLSALRAKRAPSATEPSAPWSFSRTLLRRVWHPLRRKDSALPNWIHLLVGMSDDGLRIPGTNIRLGLEAVAGALVPGAGDALGGVTAAMLMFVAWRRGAPREVLWRMFGNAALDIGVGSIPVVGDVFDFGFHANRRNLSLLEEFLNRRSDGKRASRFTALLMFGLLALLMLVVVGGVVGLLVVSWRKFHA